MQSKLYYEAHVTVEPLFGDRLEKFEEICRPRKFRVAKLLMQKRAEATPERSDKDSFATGHSTDYFDLQGRMIRLIGELQAAGIKVWRYKIEDTIIDSRINDELALIVT